MEGEEPRSAVGEEVEVKAPLVTFADYEKLMKRLEREGNFKDIEAANPKVRAYQDRNLQSEIQRQILE